MHPCQVFLAFLLRTGCMLHKVMCYCQWWMEVSHHCFFCSVPDFIVGPLVLWFVDIDFYWDYTVVWNVGMFAVCYDLSSDIILVNIRSFVFPNLCVGLDMCCFHSVIEGYYIFILNVVHVSVKIPKYDCILLVEYSVW